MPEWILKCPASDWLEGATFKHDASTQPGWVCWGGRGGLWVFRLATGGGEGSALTVLLQSCLEVKGSIFLFLSNYEMWRLIPPKEGWMWILAATLGCYPMSLYLYLRLVGEGL